MLCAHVLSWGSPEPQQAPGWAPQRTLLTWLLTVGHQGPQVPSYRFLSNSGSRSHPSTPSTSLMFFTYCPNLCARVLNVATHHYADAVECMKYHGSQMSSAGSLNASTPLHREETRARQKLGEASPTPPPALGVQCGHILPLEGP